MQMNYGPAFSLPQHVAKPLQCKQWGDPTCSHSPESPLLGPLLQTCTIFHGQRPAGERTVSTLPLHRQETDYPLAYVNAICGVHATLQATGERSNCLALDWLQLDIHKPFHKYLSFNCSSYPWPTSPRLQGPIPTPCFLVIPPTQSAASSEFNR